MCKSEYMCRISGVLFSMHTYGYIFPCVLLNSLNLLLTTPGSVHVHCSFIPLRLLQRMSPGNITLTLEVSSFYFIYYCG